MPLGVLYNRLPRPGRPVRWSQALPLIAVGIIAIAVAVFLLLRSGGGTEQRQAASQFGAAWARGDYQAMYAQLTPDAQRAVTPQAFAASYAATNSAATTTAISVGNPSGPNGNRVRVPVTMHTRVFGDIRGSVDLTVSDGSQPARIAWDPQARFPGLGPGEEVSRHTLSLPRAPITAANGAALSADPNGTAPLGPAGLEIAGSVGQASPQQRALGKQVAGASGLERVYDDQLAGMPGGQLYVGTRLIASAAPRPGQPVPTTIDPAAQQAAVAALGNRQGGIAVIRPSDGAVLGLSGLAISSHQPPGSTFKVITTAAALSAGLASPGTTYPMQNSVTLSGVQLRNDNNEVCGGTLANAFAISCNSVFAPLGAHVGASRLAQQAQAFGFNQPSRLPDEASSSFPPANTLRDDLAVGSSAIGQGQVVATPLEMASVAASIADQGMRPSPRLRSDLPPQSAPATNPQVAATIKQLMLGVVQQGTGTSAQIPGVAVAGKTGTAELKGLTSPPGQPAPPPNPADSDAWFIAFAPADNPQVAVCVMLVGAGQGGQSAAPLARQVLLGTLPH